MVVEKIEREDEGFVGRGAYVERSVSRPFGSLFRDMTDTAFFAG